MGILKVGIMGAGRIAQVMAATLNRMQEAELYAIASRSIEKAQDFAAEYGGYYSQPLHPSFALAASIAVCILAAYAAKTAHVGEVTASSRLP